MWLGALCGAGGEVVGDQLLEVVGDGMVVNQRQQMLERLRDVGVGVNVSVSVNARETARRGCG